MAATYEPIATYTVSDGTTTTITFSSIPQTYTDLKIVGNTMIYALNYYINNDNAGSHYDTEWFASSGATVVASRDLGGNIVYCYYFAPLQGSTNPAVSISEILNYTDTSNYKTILSSGGSNAPGVGGSAGLTCTVWKSTAAINRLDIKTATTYYTVGSTVTLFGIKAA